jgi:diguanylate cyclase (GGDEF)-like protein/PAS domain S-box-containing protein
MGQGLHTPAREHMTGDTNARSNALNRASERHFCRHVFESLHTLYFLSGPDSKLQAWNPAFKTAAGLPNGELTALTLPELFPDAERDRVAESIARAIQDGTAHLDVEMLSEDGSPAFYHLSLTKTSLNGQPHITGIGSEFTEARQSEAALQDARAFSETLIETANAMLIGLDTSGRITLFNPAAERITGYTRAQVEGSNGFELLVPRELYPRVWEAFGPLIAGGVPGNFRSPLLTQSGEERQIAWQSNEVRQGERGVGTIAFGIDITDQVRAELKLQTSLPFLDVAEQAPVPIVIMHANMAVQYVNPKFTELFGYTLKDISAVEAWLGDAFPDAAYRKRILKKWLQHLALSRKGSDSSLDIRVRGKDGSTHFVESHLSRIDPETLLMLLPECKQAEKALHREEAFSSAIIASAPGAFYVMDQHANFVRWNRYVNELTGLSDEQLKGTSVFSIVHDEDQALVKAKTMLAFATGSKQMELRLLTRNQGVRHFHITGQRFEVDGAAYIVGFGVDTTERKQAEEALRIEKAFSSMLIQNVPGKLCVFDAAGNYVRWNSYVNRLTGLTDEQLLHSTGLMTVAEHDRPTAVEKLQEAFTRGYSQGDWHYLSRDRGERSFLMNIRRFEVDGASYLATFGIDTTERRAMERDLERQAHIDALTGATARAQFMALAEQELTRSRRYGRPLALLILDIDYFKVVNDTYGHPAGDLALQVLVQRCRHSLRDVDILGRLGGEEFCILMPETESKQAFQAAERLRHVISELEVPLEPPFQLTVSIGVAILGDADTCINMLLSRADQALYKAKQTGRNKVCMAEGLMADSDTTT